VIAPWLWALPQWRFVHTAALTVGLLCTLNASQHTRSLERESETHCLREHTVDFLALECALRARVRSGSYLAEVLPSRDAYRTPFRPRSSALVYQDTHEDQFIAKKHERGLHTCPDLRCAA
jgi:hypothetical protein